MRLLCLLFGPPLASTWRVDFQALKQQQLSVEGDADATATLTTHQVSFPFDLSATTALPTPGSQQNSLFADDDGGAFSLQEKYQMHTGAATNDSLIQFYDTSERTKASGNMTSQSVAEPGKIFAGDRSSVDTALEKLVWRSRYFAYGGSSVNNLALVIAVITLVILAGVLTLVASKLWIALARAKSAQALARRRSQHPIDEDSASVSESSDLEWCSHRVLTNFMQGSTCFDLEPIHPIWNPESILAIFSEFGIDGSGWTEQQLNDFARALTKGRVRLVNDGGILAQLVDVVIILVVYVPGNLVLQEVARPRRKRSSNHHSAGDAWDGTFKTRLQTSEGILPAAQRCLNEKLQINVDGQVLVKPDILNVKEKRESFHSSTPGLGCISRLFILEANVITSEQHDLETLGIPAKALTTPGCTCKWEDIDLTPHVQKTLRHKLARSQGARWKGLDYAYIPVLPWPPDALIQLLRKYSNEDSDPFGKKLQELAEALSSGRLTLCLQKSNGRLLCMEERVSLVVESQHGQILVTETVLAPALRPALPTTSKSSNESIWSAALRASQKNLNLSFPLFQMDGTVLAVVDSFDAGCKDHVIREFLVRGPKLPA